MKLRGSYFLEEPSDVKNDSVSLTLLTEPSKGESGGYEYVLHLATMEFIRDFMEKTNKSFYAGFNEPLMIIRSLDPETIDLVINEILPQIDKIARRIE